MFLITGAAKAPRRSTPLGDRPMHECLYTAVGLPAKTKTRRSGATSSFQDIWITQAQAHPTTTHSAGLSRSWMFSSLQEALIHLTTGIWASGTLHVLTTALDAERDEALRLGQVEAIWECAAPAHDELCWRIETDAGHFLHSYRRIKLGQEQTLRQIL